MTENDNKELNNVEENKPSAEDLGVTYEAPKIIYDDAGRAADEPDLEGVPKEHKAMYYENDLKRKEYSDRLIAEARERSRKRTLTMALLGLTLSLVFGIGIVFSIIGLIRASFGLRKSDSQTLKWARYVSILGIILSGAFIVAMLLYCGVAVYLGAFGR